jgi:long-subunit acyl-CoA synthetase (AMP-forming)
MLDLDWQGRLQGEVVFYMFSAGDRHISYLPLAHIYERVTLYGITHVGTSIGFYRWAPLSTLSLAEAISHHGQGLLREVSQGI